jgi:hypothetical protein
VREPKASWVRALRSLTGVETDDIRWNVALARWEFVMKGADGIPRSQFWGDFRHPVDPVTGLFPFRDLDDDGMREALANLTKTFVGNPHDGAGTTRAEVMGRHRRNKTEARRRYMAAGEQFADMAVERGRWLRGAGTNASTVAGRARSKLDIPSVIGGRK